MSFEELEVAKHAENNHDAGANDCDGKGSPAEYLVGGDFLTGCLGLCAHR